MLERIDHADTTGFRSEPLGHVDATPVDLDVTPSRRRAVAEPFVDRRLARLQARDRLAALVGVGMHGVHQPSQQTLTSVRRRNRHPGRPRHRHRSTTREGQLELMRPGHPDQRRAIARDPEPVEVEEPTPRGLLLVGERSTERLVVASEHGVEIVGRRCRDLDHVPIPDRPETIGPTRFRPPRHGIPADRDAWRLDPPRSWRTSAWVGDSGQPSEREQHGRLGVEDRRLQRRGTRAGDPTA